MPKRLVPLLRGSTLAGLALCWSLVAAPLAQAQDAATLRSRHTPRA